jgi:predicted nucleotidyltransferase component of viral defense system
MNYGDLINIPLRNRLQKRAQVDVALLEDVLVRILYELDDTVEIHGGTAIWRCYGGKRFSKDIDVYVSSQDRWTVIKEKVRDTAEKYNAKVLKVKDTGNLIFMELLLDNIYSEIDVNYKKYYKNPVIRQFENLDGTFYDVLTLPAEILILEKLEAYNDRHYITDLYDMRILIDHADITKIKTELKRFISALEAPEEMEQEEKRLKDLIFEGPVPSFKTLLEYIKGKAL